MVSFEHRNRFFQRLYRLNGPGQSRNSVCEFLVLLLVFVDSGQCFVQVRIKGLVAGLNEGQSFGCESGISGWGEVGFLGVGVSSVVVVIVEIWMRVGSCDEDACDEKPDGCD